MPSGFSPVAAAAVQSARDESERLKHYYVGVEHLFLGLSLQASAALRAVLRDRGVEPGVLLRLGGAMRTEEYEPAWGTSLIHTPRLERVLDAAREAASLGNTEVSVRDLLLAIVGEPRSLPMRYCRDAGIDMESLRLAVAAVEESETWSEASRPAPSVTPTLDRFGRDLTRLASSGRMPPLVGRASEIEQMALILVKMTQNNILITGEAGTGKTHLVEGLAQAIVAQRLPEVGPLRGKRIIEIDLNAMVAGTTYRGDFEKRLQDVIGEAAKPDIVLFIDEFHLLMNAGSTSSTAGAAQVLKPYLARGEIRCIGATTHDEFAKFVETDKALVRRFETIALREPGEEETLAILQALSAGYAAHHRVRIAPGALQVCVEYSGRFMPGRRFPEKAIELLDLSCARASGGRGSVEPADIANIVFQRTGINPAADGDADQFVKGLRERLLERVIGQPEAVEAVTAVVRNWRLGLGRPGRPQGVFLLCGPSGVGKTEIARAVAEELFPGRSGLVGLDMSGYGDPASVSALIGAPPAYAGYGEGATLTDPVRRNPACVLLLDEIDKAHPSVWKLLLQVLDEGRLVDRNRREADFTNTLIFMTSNLGAAAFAAQARFGFAPATIDDQRYVELASSSRKAIERTFSAEFCNRIDQIVVFRPLSEDTLRQIVSKELKAIHLLPGLREHRLTVTLDHAAYERVIQAGYRFDCGARHLRRAFDRLVLQGLGAYLASNRLEPGSSILASGTDESIQFSVIGGVND